MTTNGKCIRFFAIAQEIVSPHSIALSAAVVEMTFRILINYMLVPASFLVSNAALTLAGKFENKV
ncbi:MAG: hypothetical protein JWR38_4797 [Mucilaginibacter sp.]|nr:hypothetical protein [Mucilaginibacter sp.]